MSMLDEHYQSELYRKIRYFAAVMSGITAVIYVLIGFNLISVLDPTTTASQMFGIPAAAAYALGAFLLVTIDRRAVWILGALLQIFVIYTYFNLASQRTPTFEVWGILLRIVQLIIFVALLYLAIRFPLSESNGTAESHR